MDRTESTDESRSVLFRPRRSQINAAGMAKRPVAVEALERISPSKSSPKPSRRI